LFSKLGEDLSSGAHQAIAVVPEPPTANRGETAAAKYYNDYNTNDDGGIVFLGLFFTWGNRHFIHDFFSL